MGARLLTTGSDMDKRAGFSLLETIVALVLLGMVMLGSHALAAGMLRTAALSNVRMQAMQIAHDRIDLIRLEPRYDSIGIRYSGTEPSIPGHAGFARTTQIARTVSTTPNGTLDFYRITVSVTAPGLQAPIARTAVVARP
jgi:prepilin-type N-terminal cleavage/methylation domain-containing protein